VQPTHDYLRADAVQRRGRAWRGRRLVGVLELKARALAHLLDTSAVSLEDAKLHTGLGVYALSYRGVYRPMRHFVRRGSLVYVGKGIVSSRCSSHSASLSEAHAMASEDFVCRVLPYASQVEAELAERLLIDALRPAWNAPAFAGFGSRPQGAGRECHQRPSNWDVLFPGRRGRAQATTADAWRRHQLELQLAAYPALEWPGR
jgi:hypothetical protein